MNPDPNKTFTTWGDLDDDPNEGLMPIDEPNTTTCVICGKDLIHEGVPPGRLVCPLHSTRGVEK